MAVPSCPPVDKVITGKDIQALMVKEEDLAKVMGQKNGGQWMIHADSTQFCDFS